MVVTAVTHLPKSEPEILKEKALGLVWIDCPYPVLALGLEETLKAEAWIHQGKTPPLEGSPSVIIYYPTDRKEVASQVNALQGLFPDTTILILGIDIDLQIGRIALETGAKGVIHAGMAPQQIIRALSVASEGEIVVPRELLNELVTNRPTPELFGLGLRQQEILELAVEGLTNAQIARRLFLSESTVKQHLRKAYKLLGVKSRTQAARLLRARPGLRSSKP